MSAGDLARWGLLVATGGGKGSHVGGVGGEAIGSWGRVTLNFNQGEIPWDLFVAAPHP